MDILFSKEAIDTSLLTFVSRKSAAFGFVVVFAIVIQVLAVQRRTVQLHQHVLLIQSYLLRQHLLDK